MRKSFPTMICRWRVHLVTVFTLAALAMPLGLRVQHSIKAQTQARDAGSAMQWALDVHAKNLQLPYEAVLATHYTKGNWAYGNADYLYRDTGDFVPTEPFVVLARQGVDGNWLALVPSKDIADEYNRWLDEIPSDFIPTDVKMTLHLPVKQFNATTISAVTGYRLPWAGGWGASLTLGPHSGGSHAGIWAWDFDLWQGQWDGTVGEPGYIVAAKSGIVVFAKDAAADSQHCTGCANVVIIQHNTQEYSWYYHIQQNSIPQAIREARQKGTSIEAGTVIGTEGNTGSSTNVHLHFMVTDGVPDLSKYDETDDDHAPWPNQNNTLEVDFEDWDEQRVGPYSGNFIDPSNAVLLYWDADYKGPSMKFTCANSGTQLRLPDFLYHQVSSIRVTPQGEYFAALYSDIRSALGSGGYCRGWWWTEANFDNDYCDPKEIPAPERAMNDAISSVKMVTKQEYCSGRSSRVGLSATLVPEVQTQASDADEFCGTPATNDNASLVSHNPLDGHVVSPGQALVKTWRMKNTGRTTWGSGHQLAFLRGDRMGALAAVNIPAAAPGQEVNISVNLTASTGEGDYAGYWRLRNPQGTYFGPETWVKVKVLPPNPGGGHITMFDVGPPSPSSASKVHLVGRVRYFPEFRSARFRMGNTVEEYPNPRQIGDQIEISTDWNTSSLPRGNYTLAFEVTTKDDPNWAHPERQIAAYTLSGPPMPDPRPPDRPLLQSPYNWYLKDAAGSSAPVQLCVYPSSDPDGDPVQYWFEAYSSNTGVINSGWIASTCWEHTFSPAIYSWKVKAGDGSHESDWSQDTWNFSVAEGGVSIGDINLYAPNTNDTHICVLVTYGGILAPEVYAWLNKAADGSENGEWRLLDHYGPNTTPDCTQSNVHGFWIRSPEYETGNHVIKVTAIKRDSGANQTKTTTYNISYIRPPSPQLVAPSTYYNNGTWWNTLPITFQWTLALRTESQQLRVSANSDLWSDPSPLVSVSLGSTAMSYVYTFTQDYAKLYWDVKAINSAGSADSGTHPWFGIDRIMPTCTVQALAAKTPESVFQVTWAGTDNSAGIRSYDIQYMDSRQRTWTDWLLRVPADKTYELFTGQPGHTHSFRCRATDKAGNTGDYPNRADTFTKVDPAARPPTPWWNSAYSWKRNISILNNMPGVALPIGYPVHLHFDTSTSPAAAEIYNTSQSGAKCDDLRVVYNDTTELDRLVESCTSGVIDIWFRAQVSVPAGSSDSTAHQLYYGNASAGAPPTDRNQIFYPVINGNSLRVYDMREGSGPTLHDATGHGDATLSSALNWTQAGKFGPAVQFPTDEGPEPRPAIDDGSANMPVNSFTVEFWLKRGPVDGGSIANQIVSGHPPRWSLGIGGDHLRLDVWPWPGAGSASVQDDRSLNDSTFYNYFHHFAVTFDGGTQVRFYIDGRLDAAKTLSQNGLTSSDSPLRIGASDINSARLSGQLFGFALLEGVKTDFTYGQFADITTEPSLAVGVPIALPASGSADLAVLDLTTYPNPGGGVLAQAVIQNQGNLDTLDGFYTDLYVDSLPTGSGYYTGSIQFWVNDPIGAGAVVTLTTVVTDLTSLGGASLQTVSAASEVTGTLYSQVDSTGAVSEAIKANNIYATGIEICVASPDAYESDNVTATAKLIDVGQTQTHNFTGPDDSDWMTFTAQGGVTYTLRTFNLGVSGDTYLYLYDTDSTTLLASNDDYGGSLASQVEWTAPATGTYYALVQHWNPNVGGCGTRYDVSFFKLVRVYLPAVFRSSLIQ